MTVSKNDLDALGQTMKAEIAKHGYHVLHEDDLQNFWSEQIILSNEEKRLMLQNFATEYGLDLYLSPQLTMVVFKNHDPVHAER